MSFPLWSEINNEAQRTLKPDLGIRSWDVLTKEEKDLIWKHLELYLFDKDMRQDEYCLYNPHEGDGRYYAFDEDIYKIRPSAVRRSIRELNSRYKVHVYAKTYFKYKDHDSACGDFYSIFSNESEHVVLELLSLYCKFLIEESKEIDIVNPQTGEVTGNDKWGYFDEFAQSLNEVFLDFGINVSVTRAGFAPRQDERIMKEIYEPVLNILSEDGWKEVNNILANAFVEYRKNTTEGYSTCVTYVVSSVQAFLQLLVNGKTGKEDIAKLIPQAQAKKLIPSDVLATGIFRIIEYILMAQRQKTGMAHPPQEYATEKNARSVLNMAMIFFQHCLTTQ